MPDVTFIDDLLDVGPEHSRPGAQLRPQGLVLHATADPGATARNIRDYFNRSKDPGQRASAHIVVDWIEALTLIPWQPGRAEVAWHAGPTANSRFLGMELCEDLDPGRARDAYWRWINAAAAICTAYGWAPEDKITIWSHAEVSAEWHETDHTDPLQYIEGQIYRSWPQVIEDIRAAMGNSTPPPRPTDKTPILAAPRCGIEQAVAWFAYRATHSVYGLEVRDHIVRLYWAVAPLYGVDPAVAVCQMAKETGFGAFGGDVGPLQWNFAGLAATGGIPGASFRTPADGVYAHVQHLRAYAEAGGPGGIPILDPRHSALASAGLVGVAPNVEDLGGHWAPDPGYGMSIVRDYVADLLAFAPAAPAPAPAQQVADIARALQDLADAQKALSGS